MQLRSIVEDMEVEEAVARPNRRALQRLKDQHIQIQREFFNRTIE